MLCVVDYLVVSSVFCWVCLRCVLSGVFVCGVVWILSCGLLLLFVWLCCLFLVGVFVFLFFMFAVWF